MNIITLNLVVANIDVLPTISVLIDNDLYEEYTFTGLTGIVNVPVELDNGLHLLTIEHTVSSDTCVELASIAVDGVKLPNSLIEGNQKSCWPEKINWEFGYPIISWVLTKHLSWTARKIQELGSVTDISIAIANTEATRKSNLAIVKNFKRQLEEYAKV